MTTKILLGSYLIVLLSGIALGWLIFSGDPNFIPVPDRPMVEYIEKPIVRGDVTAATPDLTQVFTPREIVRTRVDTVRIPVDVTEYRIATTRPININHRQVRYEYFDPSLGRWNREVFLIPEKKWDAGITGSVSIDPWRLDPVVNVFGEVRYRKVTLFAGPEVRRYGEEFDLGIRLGLRFKL